MRYIAAWCAATAIVCTPGPANAEGAPPLTLSTSVKLAPAQALSPAGRAWLEVARLEAGETNELRYWVDATGTSCHFAAIGDADARVPARRVQVHAGRPLVVKAQAMSGTSCGPLASTFTPQEHKTYVVELVRKRQGNCWLSVIEHAGADDLAEEPRMTVNRTAPVCDDGLKRLIGKGTDGRQLPVR